MAVVEASMKGQRGMTMLLFGLVCGALVTLAAPTALVGAALLAPTVAAGVFDGERGRPVARAVMLGGLAASAPSFAALWRQGDAMAAGLQIVADTSALAGAWAGQAIAWLMCELAPLAIQTAMDLRAKAAAARLRAARLRLEEEWGLPPVSPGE